MSRVGMGVTYTRGSLRQPLREQPTQGKRQELLERYYIPHHQKLTEVVEESLLANDHCLIIDGHSFPALPLPYELNQTAPHSIFASTSAPSGRSMGRTVDSMLICSQNCCYKALALVGQPCLSCYLLVMK